VKQTKARRRLFLLF